MSKAERGRWLHLKMAYGNCFIDFSLGMKKFLKKIENWAKKLKLQLVILHLAYKDTRTPWYAQALIFIIIAYALSPIDLIPDFIPIIGYLDDIVLLPIGIYFAIKLIPKNVKRECDIKAKDYKWNKRTTGS